MKIVLNLVAALAALTVLGAVLYAYNILAPTEPSVISPVVPTAQVPSAPLPGFEFTPLDQPRPLPGLRFVDGAGRDLTLAEFRGRIVILNIWATWCGPCRREMPTLDRLQQALGGQGFEVVALSIDRRGLPVVKAFYQELGLTALRIYIDKTARAVRDLAVTGIPTTLLVDREGREIGRIIGPAEWDSREVFEVIRRNLDAAPAANQGTAGASVGEPTVADRAAASNLLPAQ